MPRIILQQPKKISAFSVLIISIILDMLVFMSCYIMVSHNEEIVSSFIFNHQNDSLKYHPFDAKLLLRVEELENEIKIISNNNHKR